MDFQCLQRHVQNNDVLFFKSLPHPEETLTQRHLKSGDTVLHVACRYGSLDIIRFILAEHLIDVEVSNKDGKRPLHEAAHYSQTKSLNFLLSQNVQVDPLKRADWTPLMLACTKQSFEVVKSLLTAGADACLKNKDGWNSFHIACREGCVSILKILLEKFPLVWNTRSNNSRSPLHTAALSGQTEVVKWLLTTCDYSPDVRDSCGVTPLMDALRVGSVDTARILIHYHQADVTLEDKVGRQVIHQVAQAGQLAALEFLIHELKVPVSTPSSTTGETSLHTAAKEGHENIVEKLLKEGADINSLDHRGRSALHLASGGQRSECVSVLLGHGAIIQPDYNGTLPQQLARRTRVVQVFQDIL